MYMAVDTYMPNTGSFLNLPLLQSIDQQTTQFAGVEVVKSLLLR
jgi:hypothetical protein